MLWKLLLAFALLHIVWGFGMPSAPDPSIGAGDEECFEPCIRWLKCTPGDQIYLDELNKCLIIPPQKTVDKVLQHMEELFPYDWSSIEAAFKSYCSVDEEKQNEIYTEAVQYGVEEISSMCADVNEAEACQKMTDMSGCNTALLKNMHADGKC